MNEPTKQPKLPDPPWRVLAIRTRECVAPYEGVHAHWWYASEELNDAGDWVTMFARQESPHCISRANYLRVIDHPLNDRQAIEIIEQAKQ